jgi:hypothetical protein
MTLDAGIRTFNAMIDFINALVDSVALRHREFGALFEIDDKRDGDARIIGPTRLWRRARIAEKVAMT